MARDVTDLFENYRECTRHLRNTYFSTRVSKDWNIVEDFDEVAKVLFSHLVLGRLGEGSNHAVEQNELLIVPDADRMPLMISREKNGGGYWDHPIKCLERGDAIIAFRNYFDWDQHGLIDFRYYHGFVLASARHSDIIDHEVLIETIYGRISYEATPVA